MASRETFGSRFAVIMAMAGSAIGLGNIWRFPYTVGEGGGAAFIIVYLLSSLFLALPIFMAESIIGRSARAGAFGAMEKLAPGTKWRYVGLLTVVAPLILVSYYSVVGGWSFEYLLRAFTFSFTSDSTERIGEMFGGFISSAWGPLICHTLFIGATCLIVLAGVKNGIEKFAKISMPLLFVLIVIIMVYALTLPGAEKGVEYMVRPDFSKLTGRAVVSAMGQSFFSLSLGVGVILIYSSYISKEENILTSGLGTAFFDLVFAMIAGFAVMAAVFAAGLEPGAGPGLIFETMPYIFAKMDAGLPLLSSVIAILFFLTISVAALTSSISMVESGVAYFTEEKGFTRKRAILLILAMTWTLGALCSLSFGPLSHVRIFGASIFGACDGLISNYVMPAGGFLFTLFAGWKMSRKSVWNEFTDNGRQKLNRILFGPVYFIIRFIAPVGILIIFLTNLLLQQ